MGRLRLIALILLVVTAFARAQTEVAETSEDFTAPTPPSSSDIEQRIADFDADGSLDDSLKTNLLSRCRDALDALKVAAESDDKAAELKRLAEGAAERMESIQAELAEPPREPEPEVPAEATLKQVEDLLQQARDALETAKKTASDLEQEGPRRATRRQELGKSLTEARSKRDELKQSLQAAGTPDPEDPLAKTDRVRLAAQYAANSALIDAGEAELASYTARADLLPLRQTLATRRVGEAEALVGAWREVERQVREAEREASKRDTGQYTVDAADRYPTLAELTGQIQTLLDEATGTSGTARMVTRATTERAEARADYERLKSQIGSVARKVDKVGYTSGMGALLRKHFEDAPDIREHRRMARHRQHEVSQAQLRQIELEELRREVSDVERQVPEVLELLPADERTAEAEDTVRTLLTKRTELVNGLIADYDTFVERRLDLDDVSGDLVDLSELYQDFVDTRILWVPSVTTGMIPDPGNAIDALKWLVASPEWRKVVVATWHWAAERSYRVSVVLGIGLALIFFRRRCRRRLAAVAQDVRRFETDAFRRTVWAVLLSIAMAVPVPLLVWGLGWLLATGPEEPKLATTIGFTLTRWAQWIFLFSLTKRLVEPDGLGDAHFRWPSRSLAAARFHLRWFVPLFLAAVFITVATEASGVVEWTESLGRIAFVVAIVAIMVFVYRLMRTGGELLTESVKRDPDNLLYRTRLLWFPIVLLIPFTLGVAAVLGFYYTAMTLARLILPTVVAILALIVVRSLLFRWLFVVRRRLAVEQARQRREAMIATAEAEGAAAAAEPPAEEVDIPALDAKTRKLFQVVMLVALIVTLGTIWSEVLPALNMLDRVQVYPSITLVQPDEGAGAKSLLDLIAGTASRDEPAPPAADAAPPPAPAPPEAPAAIPSPSLPGTAMPKAPAPPALDRIGDAEPGITLGNIALALVLLLGTVYAFRDLPGLIEIVLLPRLPLDAGLRYAIIQLTRYTIAIVGALLVFGALGIGWSKVQWLAAALTFGLAFGLQEIFANFVSGLILLFERPVRVGDIVTVGTNVGRVTRIRMRATTIMDWDRRELLVPNKQFITAELTNWTLTDPITRVTVDVGIAYGADVEAVEALLLDVASKTDHLVPEMPPLIGFRNLGEHALNVRLYVYLSNRDHYWAVVNHLHREIHRRFIAEGFEIAFPKRDLQLRSAVPIEVLVRRGDRPSDGESG